MKRKLAAIAMCAIFLASFFNPSASPAARAAPAQPLGVGKEFKFGYSGADIDSPVTWLVMEDVGDNYVLLSKECLLVSSFYSNGTSSKYADGSRLFDWLNTDKYNDFYHYFSPYEQQFLSKISVSADGSRKVNVSIPTEEEINRWFPSKSSRVAYYNKMGRGLVKTDYWVLSANDLKKGIKDGKGTIIDDKGNSSTKNRSASTTSCVRVKIVINKTFADGYGNTGWDANHRYLPTGRSGINGGMPDEALILAYSAFSQYPLGKTAVEAWTVVNTHYDSASFTGALYKKSRADGMTDYCFAFRGSDSITDYLIADAKEIALGHTGKYMHEAQKWVKEHLESVIRDDIDNVNRIYIVGHSLGAYTATFVSASILDVQLLDQEFPNLTGDPALTLERAKAIFEASILSPEPFDDSGNGGDVDGDEEDSGNGGDAGPEEDAGNGGDAGPAGSGADDSESAATAAAFLVAAYGSAEPADSESAAEDAIEDGGNSGSDDSAVEDSGNGGDAGPTDDFFDDGDPNGDGMGDENLDWADPDAKPDTSPEIDLDLLGIPDYIQEVLRECRAGDISEEVAKQQIMTYVLGLLRLEVSPRFMEIFGSDGDLYDNMLNISYYKNQVVPRLRCYGFSTPGCTPSPTADDEVRMHFHNNSFGIYNDHIMNYYIKYDGISSFGSHLGRVQCFDSNFTSANVYNFHLIQNFYYFLPMADQLPA